jgi:hypothetical protein
LSVANHQKPDESCTISDTFDEAQPVGFGQVSELPRADRIVLAGPGSKTGHTNHKPDKKIKKTTES